MAVTSAARSSAVEVDYYRQCAVDLTKLDKCKSWGVSQHGRRSPKWQDGITAESGPHRFRLMKGQPPKCGWERMADPTTRRTNPEPGFAGPRIKLSEVHAKVRGAREVVQGNRLATGSSERGRT
jgi:hypothetical protein